MNMTPEQLEFVRKHGITICPPGPVVNIQWWGGPARANKWGITEQQRIALFALSRERQFLPGESSEVTTKRRKQKSNRKGD